MSEPPTNYFTCTLGQAASLGSRKPDQRIPDFLEEQSQHHPNLPAAGFYLPPKSARDDVWDYRIVTFRQLNYGTFGVAETFKVLLSDIQQSHTIALLAPSSAEFLFAWLALIRLGHPVLLIAPQCLPNAIGQLCQQCNVSVLMYDKTYEDLALEAGREAKKFGIHLEPVAMPVRSETHALDVFEEAPEPSIYPSQSNEPLAATSADVAFLHHTSGTSTGVPKPIAQTHRGSLGVLPRLDGSAAATFTTTPLYHGGVADVLRAWTSNALIWLFPGKDRPITAVNIVKCLDIAAQASTSSIRRDAMPQVKYFSSVPYVLEMMAEDPSSLNHLQSMEVVGVGGAALPIAVGDSLVNQGVNLASRFGSVECGFLMSSHRDYQVDKEWQYLRAAEDVQNLNFEPAEDGLSQLVVRKGWPHMATANREDGSYATADLFAPHPSIPNAWKYHSRADGQLTLVTGKKFDPAPMEAALAASSPAIADVLIFGNGRPYPGALAFRSKEAEGMGEEDVKEKIRAALEKLNKDSQSHARINVDMVVIMPFTEQALEKSSKGTILRSKAEEKYQHAIEKAYADVTSDDTKDLPDEALTSAVLSTVNQIMSARHALAEPLTTETDLFAIGIDSIASIQIRQALSRLLPENAPPLPLSIVQDAGTVANISQTLLQLRQGKRISASVNPQTLMRELVQKYSNFSDISPHAGTGDAKASSGEVVLLTGSTGSLGANILSLLVANRDISHIYLLVRGATHQAASERVRKALASRQLPISQDFEERVTVLPCRLQNPDLGLDPVSLTRLQREVSCIMHLAWDVNFLYSVQQFEHVHLTGLSHLLSLSASSTRQTPPHFIFCSSTASVSAHPIPIPESIITDPSTSGPTGYARSKWVAENILAAAAQHPHFHTHITIMRVGQVSGNSQSGVWNASEAYPLMLSTAKKAVLGCLPDLDKARRAQGERGEELNWLPVDYAAQAFVDVALNRRRKDSKELLQDLMPPHSDGRVRGESTDVLHVLPPPRDSVKTWSSLLVAMKMAEGVNIVGIDEWLSKLETLSDNKGPDFHPALKLLDFWREAYTLDAESDDTGSEGTSLFASMTHISAIDMDKDVEVSAGYEMYKSLQAMPSLREAREVDMGYVMRLWKWIKLHV